MYTRITNAKKPAYDRKDCVEEHAQEVAMTKEKAAHNGEGCVQGGGLRTRV